MSEYEYASEVVLIQPNPNEGAAHLYHDRCTPTGWHVIVKRSHELDVPLGPDGKPAKEVCPGCGHEIKVKAKGNT